MNSPNTKRIALSIRQPWAALLVNGLKRVEVRRWSSHCTGWIYIHAGKVIDQSPEAWNHVPVALMASARQTGGIIGRARMVGVRQYSSLQEYQEDQGLHLAPDGFFSLPRMYGILFVEPEPLPFEPCLGSLYFFEV